MRAVTVSLVLKIDHSGIDSTVLTLVLEVLFSRPTFRRFFGSVRCVKLAVSQLLSARKIPHRMVVLHRGADEKLVVRMRDKLPPPDICPGPNPNANPIPTNSNPYPVR